MKNPEVEYVILVEVMGSEGKLCCRLLSDSILRLFYFTPRCLAGVTPWIKRL